MAGHSKFKNIQHRKGAQDKKRAKIFGRLIKELTVAARGGTDPASNPRLRTALAAARGAKCCRRVEREKKKVAPIYRGMRKRKDLLAATKSAEDREKKKHL